MDKLWWSHITKAHKFLDDIVSSAVKGQSIVLSLPQSVPWESTLIDLVEEMLKMENPKNALDIVKCPKEDVGLFLLNKYCKAERRAKYRYGMTYASFLGKCEDTVLNDRYVWVTGIPKTKYNEWIEFINEYNENVVNKTPAVFILETHDESFTYKAKKSIKKLIFDQNISDYDKFAFCALAATENNCKEYMRLYLAELVSTVCNEDIELCAECVSRAGDFLEDPISVIGDITKDRFRSNGKSFTFLKNPEQIRKLVWETQLKYIFPLVEKYRSYFISKYTESINTVLPITNSYGEIVSNPEDVEIGTLLYLVRRGTISISTSEYEELEQYKNARNKLAHLNVLELDIVEQIVKKSKAL